MSNNVGKRSGHLRSSMLNNAMHHSDVWLSLIHHRLLWYVTLCYVKPWRQPLCLTTILDESVNLSLVCFYSACFISVPQSLRGHVSMLIHMYSLKPQRNIEVTICKHQADSPFYVWPNVWSGNLRFKNKYGHTWHRMPLLRPGVIKQHKPNQTYICSSKSNFTLADPHSHYIKVL